MGGTMPYKRFLDRNHLAEGDYDPNDPKGSIRGDLRRMEQDFPEVFQIGVAPNPYREALERLVRLDDRQETRPERWTTAYNKARALLAGSAGSGQTEGLRREVEE